jgi:folate-binding protein YgfZ
MQTSSPLVCPLPDTMGIEVSGPDAEAFLRAQLSRNPPAPGAGHWISAAWLDARGRVRALFRIVALEHAWLLLAEREPVEAVLAKLRMFVLRSRVELTPLGGEREVKCLLGDNRDWLAERGLPSLEQPGAAARAGDVTWLGVGPGMIIAAGPAARLEAATAGLESGSPELAALAEIRLGLPKLGAVLMERYVPQMLNLDLLGAVSFDKGCYPGQEVVARLKYRGAVKRRMKRFGCAAPAVLPAPGDEVRDRHGEAAGEVVRAARDGERVELLAVVRLDAVEDGLGLAVEDGVGLAADDGIALEPLPLPYEDA